MRKIEREETFADDCDGELSLNQGERISISKLEEDTEDSTDFTSEEYPSSLRGDSGKARSRTPIYPPDRSEKPS